MRIGSAMGRAVQGYTSFPCCAPASEEAALTIPSLGGLAGASRGWELSFVVSIDSVLPLFQEEIEIIIKTIR